MTVTGSTGGPAVGHYRPPRIAPLDVPSADPAIVDRLRAVTGLSAAFSDELDSLGYRTAVPASVLAPLRTTDAVVGRTITLRYLPTRTLAGPSRLAHLTACEAVLAGDVLVISAPRDATSSVLGGLAAAACLRAGLAGLVIDGSVRDLDEIDGTGLAVWYRAATPITGRGRLDAIEINGPVEVGGVAVLAGDVVVADRSGVVFVPAERFPELAERVLGS